jgi:uncharacterized membrane protein YtjA (UPF0391 family)
VALYWSVVFSIIAVAAAAVGFGDGSGPTGPAARLISFACVALILLIAAGRLYVLRLERRRRDRDRRAPRETRHHLYR